MNKQVNDAFDDFTIEDGQTIDDLIECLKELKASAREQGVKHLTVELLDTDEPITICVNGLRPLTQEEQQRKANKLRLVFKRKR